MKDKYVINDKGEAVIDNENGLSLHRAIQTRLDEFARQCKHEPEFDYDQESDSWLAMDYIADQECAFNLDDDLVILGDSHPNGVAHDIVEHAIDASGYAYVT